MIAMARVLFIGLPDTGKTTFLAALWHVLESQSSATDLKLTALSEDRSYLNRIVEVWRSCDTVPRTTLQSERTVELHLEGGGLGSFTLTVPDLSGEAFQQQVEQRRMSESFAGLLQDACGVVLFASPDVKKGTQIAEQNQLIAALGGAAEPNGDAGESPGDLVSWSVEGLPTQVKLVELLQFMLERKDQKTRLALVVSAWDLVENLGLAPREYMSREMPLLSQFLIANEDQLEHTVFGVSAQGGKLPSERDQLLALDPLERIKVRQGDDQGHDITKPLAWLLKV